MEIFIVLLFPYVVFWIEIFMGSSTRRTHQVHCVESVQIRSFFWLVFSCIRTEYREIRTRKNFVSGHFSHSGGVAKDFNKKKIRLIF